MTQRLLDAGQGEPDPGPPPVGFETTRAGGDTEAPGYDAATSPPADFENLLLEVLERAYGLALRLTGNRQDAEDICQDAALRAFRAFGTFRPGSNFKAWFLRILTNCYLSTRRTRRPLASVHELEDTHALYLFFKCEEMRPAGSTSDPGRSLLDRLAADDIARALESLPEEYRVVASLYFMEDLAYQEIAVILDVPIGTVRSRLHRGRQLLQKRLWMLAEDRGIVSRQAAPQLVAAGGVA